MLPGEHRHLRSKKLPERAKLQATWRRESESISNKDRGKESRAMGTSLATVPTLVIRCIPRKQVKEENVSFGW